MTRERLLDAAELLFAAQGVAHTSLQDIAQAAGVTRGAIYWHFTDKAALFNAMMTRTTLPMEETIHGLGRGASPDPLQAVRGALLEALDRIAKEPRTRRVFDIAVHKVEYVGELTAVRERHLGVHLACRHSIEKVLRRAQRQGHVRAQPSARAMAVGLLALVDGLIRHWMLGEGLFQLRRAGAQAIDLYLAGLRAQDSPSPHLRA